MSMARADRPFKTGGVGRAIGIALGSFDEAARRIDLTEKAAKSVQSGCADQLPFSPGGVDSKVPLNSFALSLPSK